MEEEVGGDEKRKIKKKWEGHVRYEGVKRKKKVNPRKEGWNKEVRGEVGRKKGRKRRKEKGRKGRRVGRESESEKGRME